MHYWLLKSEPDVYSIDDLARDGTTHWDSIRNYQARNFMRDDMQPGDGVLFYHSSTKPPGIAGLAEVVRAGYPDPSARDPGSDYYDPAATEEDPRWYMVDVRFVRKFPVLISLDDLKAGAKFSDMALLQRSRLSVQPVQRKHFDAIVAMADRAGAEAR
jgi:predicted RNA-binding protein with PUA-like domain